jgi:flagellar hook-associated protein 1 FlgK
MSLNSIMHTANSGLAAAQAGLRVTSDNIANVNTAGYVRKVLEQSSRISNGMGVGVDITGVKRVADAYLQLASLNAATSAGRAGARAELLDSAQSLFGDPGSENAYFNRLDAVLSAFSQSADDPSSVLRRTQAVSAIEDFVSHSARISNGLNDISRNADVQLSASIDRANALLAQIEQLNGQITAQQSSGGDSTGSENMQSSMLDELASLMDITIGSRLNGGVTVRSPQGQLLAGAGAATLAYNQSQGGDSFVTVTLPGGAAQPTGISISGGVIGGLLSLRNNELPGLSAQLGEYVAKAAEEINRAANASSAAPAPGSLTGRNTGLDLPTAVEGFSGQTTIAITSGAGMVQRRVDIDFTAGQMSVDGGAPTAFAAANFLASLDTALGAFGDADFSNGALSLTAQAGSGVAIADNAADPSVKAGKGFSHFFGLNDLIRSSQPSDIATGLTPASAHGFTPGGTITLRLTNSLGGRERDITVTTPAVGTMQDLLDALNDNATGVGLYGAFALDAGGRMAFTPRAGSDLSLSVALDTSARGAGRPSLTQLFGIGQEQLGRRGAAFFLDPAVAANPARLPFATLNLGAAPGTSALVTGDGRGALALSQIADAMTAFSAAGVGGAVQSTLSRYAAQFGGQIGRMAEEASDAEAAANSVRDEASLRRSSVEGVNLDEELVSLTTYQQAFNASARLIQASKDLFDVLLGMT